MSPPGPYALGSPWWPGLAKLIEDAGVLVQNAATLLAANGEFDVAGNHRLDGRLADGMGDVYATLQFVLDHCPVDSHRVIERCALTGDRLRRRHREQVAQ